MTKSRIIAMLLVAVLVLSLVVAPAPVATAAGEYTIRLANAAGENVIVAEPGATVTLALSIENNPGIVSVGVEMGYPSELALTAKPSPNIMGFAMANTMPTYTPSQNVTDNPFLVWLSMATGTLDNKLVTFNGKIADVSFKLADDAVPGDYTITLAAPSDKNQTAPVDGSGVIEPGKLNSITNIALVNCTIRVESGECDPESHTWTQWKDVEGFEATCTKGGKQSRFCTTCDKPETRDVPATGHSFTTYTETSAATCVSDAKETATCDNGCGTPDTRDVEGTATGVHSFQGQPYIDKDPATCLANGTHYRKCSVCGAAEEAVEKENSKLNHVYTGTELTYKAADANCHAAATYYHTCINGCGGRGTTTFSSGSVDANNHHGQTELRDAVAANEDHGGYTGDLYCLGCGAMLEKGEDTPKLNHTHAMNKTGAQGATCTVPGNIEYYTCTKCGKLYTDEQGTTELQPADTVIPAGHKLNKTGKNPASCTEPGNIEYYTCSVCQKHFTDAEGKNLITDTVIPATGHDMNKTAANTPKCTEPGNYEYYTCKTCGKLYEDAEGNTETNAANVYREATGHSMNKTAAQGATCTVAGNIEYYTCQICSKLYADAQGVTEIQLADTVIPAGHKLNKTEKNPASCTEPGNIEYYTCSVCQKHFADAEGKNLITDTVIPATGHDMNKTAANAPSCTEPGNYEYYTCKTCGKLYEDAEGNTETNAANVYREATGHSMNKTAAQGATCTVAGNIEYYTCQICSKLYADAQGVTEIQLADTVIPAGHKLNKTEKNPASCTEPGNIEYYTCSVCQKHFADAESKTEITAADIPVKALGHKIEKVAAKKADCTEQGNIEHYACVNGCGELYEDAEGTKKLEASAVFQAALGHDMVEHAAVNATVEAEGSILHYECKTCKKLFAADKQTVIEQKDTVIPKLPKPESVTPPMGDGFNASLWIAVALLACLSLAVTVVVGKKVIR